MIEEYLWLPVRYLPTILNNVCFTLRVKQFEVSISQEYAVFLNSIAMAKKMGLQLGESVVDSAARCEGTLVLYVLKGIRRRLWCAYHLLPESKLIK
jgi:hypothetical protein